MTKCALVTGGAGFIGANLVRRLLADGHEVSVFVHHANLWRLDDVEGLSGIYNPLLDNQDGILEYLQIIAPDWIFHLAAYGVYPWQTSMRTMVDTNIAGTANLLRAAKLVGFEAFVQAGSSVEYGFKDHAPTEDEPIAPNTDYGLTKAAATRYAQETGGNITTLRLYSPYGPYEASTRLIPTLIEHGLRGELPPMANPDNARDFVHVEDVCDAFVRAAAMPTGGQIYNVGTGVQTSLRQVVGVAKRLMQIKAEPVWNAAENRVWDTNVWVANNEKIKRELGWQPRYTFEQGLQATIEWTRERGKVAA